MVAWIVIGLIGCALIGAALWDEWRNPATSWTYRRRF
jgi:uncharacterized protein (DUF983 family)